MYRFLKRNYVIDPNNVHILTDDTQKKPTHRNIIKEIRWLISGCRPGDSLFLHYSGHGSYVSDNDHDEEDCRDEALVPIDYHKKGLIIDDDLRELMITSLPHDVKLFCIIDACHSGTILDLRHKYECDGSTFKSSKHLQYPNTFGEVVTLRGCADHDVSADSREENVDTGKFQYQGALTYTFLKLMKKHKNNISLKDLVYQLNVDLKHNGYSQRPVLCTGSKMNINKKCKLLHICKNKDSSTYVTSPDDKRKRCILI